MQEAALTIWWAAPTIDASVVLSPPERASIDQLQPADHRARAATSRALLRVVCAAAFTMRPTEVTFSYDCAVCGAAHGPPHPVPPAEGPDLYVSVARSGGLVLVAAGEGGPVGVDVERIAATAFDGFDRVALTDRERLAIGRLPSSERDTARARAWVRKEARLKRLGLGLTRSPSDVDVTADVDPDVDRLAGKGIRFGPDRVTDIDPAEFGAVAEYRIAVATTGPVAPRITVIDGRAALAAAAARVRTATA